MSSFVQYVGVNHSRADVFVTQQLLDRADIIAGFSKCVAKEWRKVCSVLRL